MAASPPLLLLSGSGNKGVKRDTKAAERLQRKEGKRGQGWLAAGGRGEETRIKAK